jgi:hypothetical protein
VDGLYIPEYKKRYSYSLGNNNCEHLSTLILTGVSASQQISTIVKRVLMIVGYSTPPLEDVDDAEGPRERSEGEVASEDDIIRARDALLEPPDFTQDVPYYGARMGMVL